MISPSNPLPQEKEKVDKERERQEREERRTAERAEARIQRELEDLTKDQRTIFVSQLTKKVTTRVTSSR
jgi:molybdopterin-biosynthesis enzyme MoeA-like protein